jgi:hypothetical protein
MPVILVTWEIDFGSVEVQIQPMFQDHPWAKNFTLPKKVKQKRTGGVAQVVELKL